MGNLVALTGAAPGATLPLAAIVLASLIGLYRAPSLIDLSLFRPFWLVSRRGCSTLIASGVVRADLGHLFLNAFTFWAFAFSLEREIGTVRFLALHFFGLLTSDLGTYKQFICAVPTI